MPYNLEGTALLRFLADIYGHSDINSADFKYEQKTATAKEVIDYLCNRFKIGAYEKNEKGEDTKVFLPGEGYTPKEVLELVTIRYEMNLYSFQKYIATTVATKCIRQDSSCHYGKCRSVGWCFH